MNTQISPVLLSVALLSLGIVPSGIAQANSTPEQDNSSIAETAATEIPDTEEQEDSSVAETAPITEIENLAEIEFPDTDAQLLVQDVPEEEIDEEEIDEEEIEDIVITGTRSERRLQDTPGTITVIEGEEIDRQLINDLTDLIRYETRSISR